MQTSIRELGQLEELPPDLASIRDDVVAATSDAIDAKKRFGELPKPPSYTDQLARGFVYGLIRDYKGGIEFDQEVTRQAEALQKEVRRIVWSIERLRGSGLMLPDIAKKFAGPKHEGDSAIQIDFDEAWPEPGIDWLTVTNNTGLPLHNCTIAVKLSGRAGANALNVHFFPEWQPTQSFHCPYSPERSVLDKKYLRQTVPGVQAVTVDLFADELSQENIRFQYAGNERDSDVLRYCGGLEFHTRYRPFAKGTLWNDQAAVFCHFSGKHPLPKGSLKIELANGAYRASALIDFASWKPEQELKVEFPDERWEPTSSVGSIHIEGSAGDFKFPVLLGP